jgi:predicted AlkP superfamily pyrophosphatase or phosphodiesterase
MATILFVPNPILLISVDGMRPDGLVQADTPCIDRLIATGSHMLMSRTVIPSVTLPCHTSMHRGVDVPRHGITTNTFHPLARPVPSLFDVVKAEGLKTAMFFNWAELRDLMEPASVDLSYSYNDASCLASDHVVADAAVWHIARNDYDLVFLYLGYTDTSGHDHGWMSEPYITAISNADRCIEKVLTAYEAKGARPNVLLLSDHGGHERSHGTEMPEDMTIPWVMNGPDIKVGFEITEPVRIYDACPTLAALAGARAVKQWDGRVVTEAFVDLTG